MEEIEPLSLQNELPQKEIQEIKQKHEGEMTIIRIDFQESQSWKEVNNNFGNLHLERVTRLIICI